MKSMSSGRPGSARSVQRHRAAPRRHPHRAARPRAPSRASVAGASETVGAGSSASSTPARRVIAPVCQCSSSRPVVSTKGKSASGSLRLGSVRPAGDEARAAGRRGEAVGEDDLGAGRVGRRAGIGDAALALQPLPGDVAPGSAWPAPSRRRPRADARRSSRRPRRRAISTMIARSCRASPGSGTAARPICTWRLVLVTVPSFSGQAEAGSTTSASAAVSVRKRSCTTR